MFINYAHRGASAYAPENTLSAFYLGIQMGANGIETDIHRTKDGILVLFHDDSLERVTEKTGLVGEYTYQELKEILIYGNSEYGFRPDRIVSLETFLYLFGHLDLTFALELKDTMIQHEVLSMTQKYRMTDKCIFTSFEFDELISMRKEDKTISLGYLTREINGDLFTNMHYNNIQQLCVNAEIITPELVEQCHQQNLSIRAWGVKSVSLMKHALDCGVDGGMTVNFPDKLTKILKQNENINKRGYGYGEL